MIFIPRAMLYNLLSVGDIILIPFPFTDLSSSKSRPAVILSRQNTFTDDFIVGAISSKSSQNDISITTQDLKKGRLPVQSFFKKGKIVTLHSSLIQRKIGELKESLIQEILHETRNLF